MLRALTRIKSEPWAITSDVMETILAIAERDNLSPEAVAQDLGRPLDNTYNAEVRDGIAILPVQGPMIRHANLFSKISGATSYDMLAVDFKRALDNPDVRAIVLDVDSPGGEANGVSEFADQIFAARGTKPVITYAGGQMCSAAYWVGAASDEIVVSDTSLLGSIGVVMTMKDATERDAKAGIKTYEIVSSHSPLKRAGPDTDEGMARMQALVDSLSDVFVAKVAKYRGTTPEAVLSDFGQGGVRVGQEAVAAGMADRVGSFEQVLSELRNGRKISTVAPLAASAAGKNSLTGERKMLTADQVKAEHPDAAKALVDEGRIAGHAAGLQEGKAAASAEGATAERARIRAILGSDDAKGRTTLAQHLAFESDMSAEQAAGILKNSVAAQEHTGKPQGKSEFEQHMDALGNPQVGAEKDDGNLSDEDKHIREMQALGRSLNLVR